MEQHKDILKEVNRNDGITVPDGYFQDFAASMIASLPEYQPTVKVKPTLWLRIKPYAYMAAMFAGIFCMMKMFDMMRNPSSRLNIDNYPALTATLEENQEVPYSIVVDLNQYEILEDIYNDGFSADELFSAGDSIDMTGDIDNSGSYKLPTSI